MLYSTSMFSQVLDIIPKKEFSKNVWELDAEKASKGFTCWEQLVSMLFCQLNNCKSLREICDGLRSCGGKINHFGISDYPKRSTLSYANANRPWELYEKTFYNLLAVCQNESWGKKKKFRFKNKLLSLDATTIDLCASMYDWAKFRQTKGAVKIHLILDHNGYLPVFVNITDGLTNEMKVANMLDLSPETIVVMDRGYSNFKMYYRWTKKHVWFVTRMKDRIAYKVVEKRKVASNTNILSDEIIRFTVPASKTKCPAELRRIVVWDEKKQEVIVLLTNHMRFVATTIAEIYKDRWEIEIFFKILKQNLRIKTFVGTSANALKIQIWTALIAMLLLKYLKLRSKYHWSFSNMIALFRLNILTYKNLWIWIDCPFEAPPVTQSDQLTLQFLDSTSENMGV
jgi:hypothetical protein